jgi:hypothetical protein
MYFAMSPVVYCKVMDETNSYLARLASLQLRPEYG